jgi:hypothetical protein
MIRYINMHKLLSTTLGETRINKEDHNCRQNWQHPQPYNLAYIGKASTCLTERTNKEEKKGCFYLVF